MWSEDLRVGDSVVNKAMTGAAAGRYEVDSIKGSTLFLRKFLTSWVKGKPQPFSYREVEMGFHMPKLERPAPRFGERAFLLVHTVYDDGAATVVPWVEGRECPFDGGDGVTFELLGMVDARAASLEEPELWAHKEELIQGTYRFFGEASEPSVIARATNPDIDTEEAPRGRIRGRRSR